MRALANRIQKTYDQLPEWKKGGIVFDPPSKDKKWTIEELRKLPRVALKTMYHVKAQYFGKPQPCRLCDRMFWIANEGGYGTQGCICTECLVVPHGEQLELFDESAN